MKIRSHRELEVYKMAFRAAMQIFELSKGFPPEERFSLTDQIRRSSRSVCGNIAKAFRKRRYPKAFVARLSDSEGEAAETVNWLDLSLACRYITKTEHNSLFEMYDNLIRKLVNMSLKPEDWTF